MMRNSKCFGSKLNFNCKSEMIYSVMEPPKIMLSEKHGWILETRGQNSVARLYLFQYMLLIFKS